MARKLLWSTFALPVGTVAFLFVEPPPVVRFSLAALALLPLAWLIGEATEQTGKHTGPVLGGLANATFGNAVELFVSYFALADRSFDVVRGSLTGSIVSNLLLVLGLGLVVGGSARLDAASTRLALVQIGLAAALFVVPAALHWSGRIEDGVAEPWVVFAIFAPLLVAYWASTGRLLLRKRGAREEGGGEDARWSLRRSLALLAAGVAAAGFVSELMTGAIDGFASALGVSTFVVAVVFVAIAGNAAEHGSALLVASRGNVQLAAEVALQSASQVAAFLVPAVAMLSWLVAPLALSFLPVEVAVLLAAAALAGALLARSRSSRWRGLVLTGGYGVALAAFVRFG